MVRSEMGRISTMASSFIATYYSLNASCDFNSGSLMTNAPLCALTHLMNALLAGFFELTALFSSILAFLSSCDITNTYFEHSGAKIQKKLRNTSGLSIKSDERRAKVLRPTSNVQ